jgi:hypothetical protein
VQAFVGIPKPADLTRAASASQCLCAGTCFPDRIIEAVDFEIEHAAMISLSFTRANPSRIRAKSPGLGSASG